MKKIKVYNNSINNESENEQKSIKKAEDEIWFAKLQNDIEWKRILVCMNNNFFDKQWAHSFLSNPIYSLSSCQPILHHMKDHFAW